jgi:hypothetical protein
MLYLLNRFVVSIQTESNARSLSDEEARVASEADTLVSRRFNISKAVDSYLLGDDRIEPE